MKYWSVRTKTGLWYRSARLNAFRVRSKPPPACRREDRPGELAVAAWRAN